MWGRLQTSSLTCLRLVWIFPSCPAANPLLVEQLWLSGIAAGQQQSSELCGFQGTHDFSWPVVKSLCKCFKAWGDTEAKSPDFQFLLLGTAPCSQPSPAQFSQHRHLFLSKQRRRKLPKFLGEPVKTHLSSLQLMDTVKYLCQTRFTFTIFPFYTAFYFL